MTAAIVSDTGPLIALARVEQLDLLRRLYGQIIIPSAVHAEFALGSRRPGAKALAATLEAGWVAVQPASDRNVVSEIAQHLDRGEAEAIALAEQWSARFLLIDDAKGRRIARQRGVRVVGVAGVLLAAKSQGELGTVAPVLDELSRAGYRLSPRLVAGVLVKADELGGVVLPYSRA